MLKATFENSADVRIPPSEAKDRARDPVAEVPVLILLSPCFPEMERHKFTLHLYFRLHLKI